MKKIVMGLMLSGALVSSAHAATTMSAAPAESWTVTNFYKQAVYDPKESKIGDVDDVLVDKSGKVTGLVIGVGGFLGAGEKDVIVPFTAVKTTKKNDKWWLTWTKRRTISKLPMVSATTRPAQRGCPKRSNIEKNHLERHAAFAKQRAFFCHCYPCRLTRRGQHPGAARPELLAPALSRTVCQHRNSCGLICPSVGRPS